jgi:F-type H+-transporting ATPase subunit b
MLDINPILLVITLATFIFLVGYLNQVLYKPLLKYMDERDESLKSDRDSVSQNYAEIDALNEEAETVLSIARKEATSSKEAILSETKEKIAKMVEEKKKEFSNNYQQFLDSLGNERVSLKNRLLADSSSIESALRDRFTSI